MFKVRQMYGREAEDVVEINRTVQTRSGIKEVFAYLSDFTTTTEWDPGTVKTTRESGDGSVGTRYHNESTFLGRRTTLTYVVTEYVPPTRIRLRGENDSVIADDTITMVDSANGGTSVTYSAHFTLKGWKRWLAPVLAPAFRRLGDQAEKELQQALANR